MSTGFKISKELYDVKSCNDRDQVINSDLSSLKVYLSGEFSVTLPANQIEVEAVIATHNLGYKPMYLICSEVARIDTSGQYSVTNGERYIFSTIGDVSFVSWTTTTQLKIKYYPVLSDWFDDFDKSFHGHYYIFHNPI